MTTALISHSDCLKHVMSSQHPECPERLQVIERALGKTGLMAQLARHEAPLATREQLIWAHSETYVDEIFRLAPAKGLVRLDPDTTMNPDSLPAALRAAGALILAVDLVMGNESASSKTSPAVQTAFCNVRPPGHHAERDHAMGFCIFNNIAIGAAHALEHHGLKRVAIVDFDVHHGNGTEDIFRDNDRVLLCSSFQYPFYPVTDLTPSRDGIIKIPLPAGTGSAAFRDAIMSHCLPALEAFRPELIFFSAGFDAHRDDPLANLLLVEEDYAWITQQVMAIAHRCCSGRAISTLEGGYALNVLGQCAAAHIRALGDVRNL